MSLLDDALRLKPTKISAVLARNPLCFILRMLHMIWPALWQSPRLDRMAYQGKMLLFSVLSTFQAVSLTTDWLWGKSIDFLQPRLWQSFGLDGLAGQGMTVHTVGKLPAFLQNLGRPRRCKVW